MIVSTEAVVLHSMKYGDTSKIVSLYSRKYGKIKVIAKGARTLNNKFGASLEPLTYSSVVFYKKEQKTLYLLSKSEIVQPQKHLFSHSEKMLIGLALVELINKVMHDEEEHEEIFQLLTNALHSINTAEKNLFNIIIAFQLQLFHHFGFGLELQQCSHCKKNLHQNSSHVYLLLSRDAVMCSQCHETHKGGIGIPQNIFSLLSFFASNTFSAIYEQELSSSLQKSLTSILHSYMHYHIEETKNLHSLSLLHSFYH